MEMRRTEKILDLSPELEKDAGEVFSYKTAIGAFFEKLLEERAEWTRRERDMWARAVEEAKEQGFDITDEEFIKGKMSFAYREQKFSIKEDI